MSATELPVVHNPVEDLLRQDRIPTIWCPGCGIGTTVNSFAHALLGQDIDLKKTAIVSGIGCSGRVSGYMNLDSFHTTHGRAIPFAAGLKLARPELKVVVYSGDGDLFAIGGNHFVHAARRNMALLVVCVNNFNYGMTGGQLAPTTPEGASQTTMADIIDGTTNTYLCGEKFLDPGAYTTGSDAGDDQNLYTGCQDDVVRWVGTGTDATYAPRQDRSDQSNVSIFGSAHSSGFNVAMCDASVRLVSYSIDLETHRRLGNRKDQLPIDGSKL